MPTPVPWDGRPSGVPDVEEGSRREQGRAGGVGGWGGQVSLEPTGPGESAGLCPNPPARPSQLLLWCVVRASLVMCSLRFSKIRGLVARLTAPPSSALHLRVGEGSSRVPPTAGPQLSWSPVLSLPVTLRKDSGRGASARPGHSRHLPPAPGSVTPARLLPPAAWGSCPSPLPPRKPPEASTHTSFGVPWSPQRPWGLPCPQVCLRPLSLCCCSSVLSEILTRLLH